MMYSILNIVRYLVGCLSFYIVLKYGFGYETKQKVPLVSWAVATIVMGIFVAIELFFCTRDDAFDYCDLFLVPTTIFGPYLFFQKKKRFRFVLFGLGLNGIIDFVWYYLLSLVTRAVDGTSETSIISVCIYLLIFMFISVLAILVSQKSNAATINNVVENTNPIIFLCLLFPVFSVYFEKSVKGTGEHYGLISVLFSLASIGLIIFCIIYVFVKFVAESNIRIQAEKQLEVEIHHYEEMINKNNDVRRFRHDFKNNLISINQLLNNNRPDEAKKYIQDMYGVLDDTKVEFNTGNYMADAILADKKRIANEQNTDLIFSSPDGTCLPKTSISNYDMCTLLSNLLDNAVRACENIEKAKINVIVSKFGKILTIAIENPTVVDVEIIDNKIKTTKSDTVNHGLGLENVKKVAGKYKGQVDLNYYDHRFIAEIKLVIEGE